MPSERAPTPCPGGIRVERLVAIVSADDAGSRILSVLRDRRSSLQGLPGSAVEAERHSEGIGANMHSANFAMLDNLTISAAARLLRFAAGDDPSAYEVDSDTRIFRDAKWDYDANESLEIAVDVACLAQLVQAIVLFEGVALDRDHLDRWGHIDAGPGGQVNPEGFDPGHVMNALTTVVDVQPLTRHKLLEGAISDTRSLLHTPLLREFLSFLSHTSTDGLYVQISSAYFETGYSDPNLFPSSEISETLDEMALDAFVSQVIRESGLKTRGSRRAMKMAFRAEARKTAASVPILPLEFLHGKPGDQFHQDSYGYDDPFDQRALIEGVMRNMVAATFYRRLSESMNLAYCPHPLRSAFVGLELLTEAVSAPEVINRLRELLDQRRLRDGRRAQELFGQDTVDVRIPHVLTAVLRRSKDPSEVLDAAFVLRESRPAKAFRHWLNSVEDRLSQNKLTINDLLHERSGIEKAMGLRPSDEIGGARPGASVSLSLGPASVTLSSLGRQLGRDFLGRPHLRLLQTLMQVSNESPNFAALVSGVLGERVGVAWRNYRTVVRASRAMVAHPSKRYQPLRRAAP
jgi:hypothetical protein